MHINLLIKILNHKNLKQMFEYVQTEINHIIGNFSNGQILWFGIDITNTILLKSISWQQFSNNVSDRANQKPC